MESSQAFHDFSQTPPQNRMIHREYIFFREKFIVQFLALLWIKNDIIVV